MTVSEDRERLIDKQDMDVRTRYRYAIVAFALLGISAAVGAVVLPESRTVLLSFAGIGLFAAILFATVVRERFLSADVAEALHSPVTDNQAEIAAVLGLEGSPQYVPTADSDVKLHIPDAEYSKQYGGPPDTDRVLGEDSMSLSLTPVGKALLEQADLPDKTLPPLSHEIIELLAEITCSEFELADSVTRLNDEPTSVTIRIEGNAIGNPKQLDNPVVSLFATGLALGLDQPIYIEDGPERFDGTFSVTFEWQAPTSQTVLTNHVAEKS